MKRAYSSKSDRREREARDAQHIRACCPTSAAEPHLANCVRPLGRCRDKVGYSTRDKARRAAAKWTDTSPMTAYRCDACQLWHYGHPGGDL